MSIESLVYLRVIVKVCMLNIITSHYSCLSMTRGHYNNCFMSSVWVMQLHVLIFSGCVVVRKLSVLNLLGSNPSVSSSHESVDLFVEGFKSFL